jgi:uncharacterized surface anchored protein
VTGKVELLPEAIHHVGPGHAVLRGAVVRLCSRNRVMQTQTDDSGSFKFADVAPGDYDLVVGGKGWPANTVKGVQVRQADIAPITIEMTSPATASACFIDVLSRGSCSTTRVWVEYDEPKRQSLPVLVGAVKWQKEDNTMVILSKAQVTLRRAGSRHALQSMLSDGNGRFEFHPEPGDYQLLVSRSGFQEVRVGEFLVPLENRTHVTIFTMKKGIVVVCQ